MKKTIVCTVCPNGCEIEAEYTCREDIKITGNKCNRGIAYCTDECFDPRRTFTSSVRISGAGRRMLPVRTTEPVSKALLMRCAEEVHKITVNAPVKRNQIISPNFLDTGADLIAAMSLEEE